MQEMISACLPDYLFSFLLVYFFVPAYNRDRGRKLSILIFVGIPILLWAAIMLLSLREVVAPEEKQRAPARADSDSIPHFSRDYTGRVWVDPKRKGFFRTIRRRGVTPPNELEE